MPDKWKIFYADGTTFDSGQGTPQDAPAKDVGVLVQEDGRCGRRILKFMDWFRWDVSAGRWFDCEQFDVLFYLTRHGTVTALRGQYMPEAKFQKILIAAHDDDFIKAISPGEPAHPAWKKEK